MIINMDYEKFKDELFAAILQGEEMEGKHVRLLERENSGNGGELLCIVWMEGNSRYMLYWELSVLYNNFLREGWKGTLSEMAYRLKLYGFLRESMDDGLPKSLLRRMENYENVILRPLNYNYYKNELKDSIYWRFGDIALVLYRMIYQGAEKYFAEKVSRKMTEKMYVSDKMILTNALFTTCSEMPPRLYNGTDCVQLLSRDKGSFMNWEKAETKSLCVNSARDGIIGYRLSTVSGANGAIALFYPGVRERLSELLGGDYYVGFISVHEVVIHPVKYKGLSEMKAALLRINALCDKKEMLTNNVYRYCGGQKRLVEV